MDGLNGRRIEELHATATSLWYTGYVLGDIIEAVRPASAVERLVLEEHVTNMEIWRLENEVRHAGDQASSMTLHRQSINSERNRLIYQINTTIFKQCEMWLSQREGELQSESPGAIIDRMSILRLKIFHGIDANEELNDLVQCLSSLMKGIATGRKYFKLYRNLKTYEDEDCRHYPVA